MRTMDISDAAFPAPQAAQAKEAIAEAIAELRQTR
jgi:hypothetical protein